MQAGQVRAVIGRGSDYFGPGVINSIAGERLFPAIRAAVRGETVLAPTVATRLVSRMRRPAEEALTSREVEVLGLVARGSSNAEIAGALFISEATVKTHLVHVYDKLGVDSRTAAVRVAVRAGVAGMDFAGTRQGGG